MNNDLFMHKLHEEVTGKQFKESETVDDIKKLLKALGMEIVSDDIAGRLSLLSMPVEGHQSHFQDAKDIAEIIDKLLPEDLSEKETNKSRLASLLHDIGKSGPPEATPEEQKAFVDLFNLHFDKSEYDFNGVKMLPFEIPLKDALEIKIGEGSLTPSSAKKILKSLTAASARQIASMEKNGEKIHVEMQINDKTPMGSIWASHVFWTYLILKKNNVDQQVVEIASSHHLLEDNDPAQIGLENSTAMTSTLEITDKYQAFRMRESRIRLILADKYQAGRVRGALNHNDAVMRLKEMVKKRLKDMESVKELYMKALKSIEENQELLERELELGEDAKQR